ncbi:MFS transporter [Devosia sp.]|uniref:MFS transporter n=1 Tax=Devosia sp. TaxID=1871048 RepID=UPI003A924CBA
MPAIFDAWRRSPELRASVFHSTVFGTNAVSSVYLGIWLTNQGMNADEIGFINAAPVLAMLAINVFIGRLADRAKDWRSVIIVLALLAAAAATGLWFVSGFWSILLVWMMTIMPAFSLVPVTDAATMRMTERRGSDFAFIRGWGTIGFVLTTLLVGGLVATFGDAAFVPLFVGVAAIRALVSLQLPVFRSGEKPKPTTRPAGASRMGEVLKPWFVIALLGLGFLYSTHGALGAFAALSWTRQGISEAWIGPLIAVMAGAEAVMMFAWRRLKIKVSARHLIMFACLVAVVRYGAMAFAPPLWLLFGLQMLHAITFAVGYLGGMYFIANWTTEEIAAEAQGFSFVLQQAMSVIVLVGMGWCYANFGDFAWAILAAYVAVGAGLVALSLRLKSAANQPTTADDLPLADPGPLPPQGAEPRN